MGVVPDYRELGKAAAMIVHRHQQGTKLKDMPVQAAKKPLRHQSSVKRKSTGGFSQNGGHC